METLTVKLPLEEALALLMRLRRTTPTLKIVELASNAEQRIQREADAAIDRTIPSRRVSASGR